MPLIGRNSYESNPSKTYYENTTLEKPKYQHNVKY